MFRKYLLYPGTCLTMPGAISSVALGSQEQTQRPTHKAEDRTAESSLSARRNKDRRSGNFSHCTVTILQLKAKR